MTLWLILAGVLFVFGIPNLVAGFDTPDRLAGFVMVVISVIIALVALT